jgi:hypothetical protein
MAKQYFKAVSILSLLAMVLAFVPAGSVHADAPPPPPTVNGLFYLDGDVNNYYYLGESGTRGTLYYRLQGGTLYVAVVVSHTVNDNVFGMKGTDGAYLLSADWTAVHTANRLIGSDHLELSLECGAYSWDWFQDYVYDDGMGGWLSDPYGPDGNGTPPPWPMETASSGQWNLNNSAWDYTAGRDPTDDNTWLSLNQGDPNTVLDDGWYTSQGDPAVNTVDDPAWEWAMVYEMSIDVSACGSNPITIWPVSAHNSPSKDGDQDIPFEPVDLFDFGDAPDTYGTTLGNDGARHALVVGGPYLGPSVDAEKDGQPLYLADGDDINTQNDADGVIFLTPFTPGKEAQIQVTLSADACLNFWIDFDGNGTFDPDEHFQYTLTGGTHTLTIDVPIGAIAGLTYSRFRLSSECNLGPTGPAPDGEVEDYVLPLGPTAVELLSFTARPDRLAIRVRWETASEIDNAGFNLYRATALEGEKVRLNADLIPSKVPPGNPIGATYDWLDTQVVAGTIYYYWLEDVDIYGRATLHGPVKAQAQGLRLLPSGPTLTDR